MADALVDRIFYAIIPNYLDLRQYGTLDWSRQASAMATIHQTTQVPGSDPVSYGALQCMQATWPQDRQIACPVLYVPPNWAILIGHCQGAACPGRTDLRILIRAGRVLDDWENRDGSQFEGGCNAGGSGGDHAGSGEGDRTGRQDVLSELRADRGRFGEGLHSQADQDGA